MKKLLALILAALMLLACTAALAEEAEYPEVVEGIDFGGADIYVYDYWTATEERQAEPSEQTQAQ